MMSRPLCIGLLVFDPRLTPNRPTGHFSNNYGPLRFYCI